MSETTEARTLRVVLDGLIAHRETNLTDLIKKCNDEIARLTRMVHTAQKSLTSGCRTELFGDSVMDRIDIDKLRTSIKETEVTIGNIESVSRGSLKFFDKQPAVKKASNVTKLPAAPIRAQDPLKTGSQASTGTNQGSNNPGRERQRRRKESQNDQ